MALTRLPPKAAAGWLKSTNNPVLGGSLGTCFDVSVLKEDDRFRMWFSWRPKKSVALVESSDGQAQIVLGPNRETDWENDINRSAVLKRSGTYHMWDTGPARKRSRIGYATRRDGVSWTRVSKEPVLSADSPWEKNIAVMCPHVLWDEPAQLYRMWYSGGEQCGSLADMDGASGLRSPPLLGFLKLVGAQLYPTLWRHSGGDVAAGIRGRSAAAPERRAYGENHATGVGVGHTGCLLARSGRSAPPCSEPRAGLAPK